MNIDPNLLSIILGLITNGLSSLIGASGKKAGNLLIGKDFLEKWELEKTSLEPVLHTAISNVVETFHWQGPATEEVLASFLLLPETQEIVRQMYSTRLEKGKKQHNLASIQQVFLTSLTLFVNLFPQGHMLSENDLHDTADFLFDLLLKECDFVLENANDRGLLAAHEAKSAMRHHVIASEIEAVHKKLNFLVSREGLDYKTIIEFEKKYRSQVGSSHSSITPPNFDSARKLPIDEIFVTPRVRTVPRTKKDEHQVLTMEAFFARAFRAVLLGNPGGGKSTLSLKLCHDSATYYPDFEFAGRKQLTPILIILREYGADKKDRKCSILEFIETEAKATYQLTTPPSRAFEYLLLSGRAMVIFDGLDELLDTSYRQEIRDDVEAFCRYYPSVPVLVTSREVGYEQAPLNEKMFETYMLAEFDDNQIKEYVEKWFNVEDREIAQKQRKDKIESFLKESVIVPDLRSNPLMLSLLCNIYRGENYIPRNRPEVYDKCATMLFERWDKSRNLYVPPILEEHMRPLMEYLAQWIFEDEVLRKGVTEQELVTKATEYLSEWVFDNIFKAERVAHDFIQFCTVGRGWVFLDTGTKKEGEKLYQFAHTTFLEYFTASFFVRKYRTPDKLIDVLLDRIAKREWDVMAQLAFQLQSKRMSGAADELLMALIDEVVKNSSNRSKNCLSFAIRCLQFMTPRPKVVRCITEVWMKFYLPIWEQSEPAPITYRRVTSELRDKSQQEAAFESLRSMLDAVPHNYEVAVDTFEKQLLEYFNGESEVKALYAWEVLHFLLILVPFEDQEKKAIHLSAYARILSSCSDRLIALSQHNFFICRDALDLGIIHISDFIKWHEIRSIFRTRYSGLFSVDFSSIYENFTFFILTPHEDLLGERQTTLYKNLKELGHILLALKLPWFKYNINRKSLEGESLESIVIKSRGYYEYTLRTQTHKKQLSFDSDIFFVAFALFATIVEANDEYINHILDRTISFLELPFKDVLLARDNKKMEEKVQFELDQCGFSTEQKNFIWHWVRKEVNLLHLAQAQKPEKEDPSNLLPRESKAV